MDNISIVLIRVVMLFLMMVPAIVLKKAKMTSERTPADLAAILLYITNPSWTIYSFIRPYDSKIALTALMILGISFLIHGLTTLGSLLLFRKTRPDKAKVLRFMIIFSNAGYMCFPILQAMYGSIGVLYGSIYCVGFNLFIWTVGVALYRGDRESFQIKHILLNPAMVSTYIAFAIFATGLGAKFSQFEATKALSDTLKVIGEMTSPLSMFIIGIRLTEIKFKKIFTDFNMFGAISMRLLVVPVVVFVVLKLLGAGAWGAGVYALQVPVISSLMPAATATVIFAERLGGNATYASKCVVTSTALSILTIPLLLTLFTLFS